MSDKKIVHIFGTGTVGLPLIGLFCRFKDHWGIDEVTFHKNTPLEHDTPQIKQLVGQGAILCTDEEKFEGFKKLGLDPAYTRTEAIARADVIIDCTPAGLKGKPLYEEFAGKGKLFLAQGSEKGFGDPYARGINESSLNKQEFVQIVSCNTHNIAVVLDTLSRIGKIYDSHFVCIRRSNDISQDTGMSPSIQVNKHSDTAMGTHHGRDVFDLFLSAQRSMPVYSSACKIGTQYMHTIQFNIALFEVEEVRESMVEAAFRENRKVAITNKMSAHKVFSFGREYGHYGRILNQTVLCLPSLHTRKRQYRGYEISGFCFTPQDSNSLLSSVAAALWHLHDRNWEDVDILMDCVRPFLFQEI